MEELGQSVRLAPNSFIAQLKMGELWMRLRTGQPGRRVCAAVAYRRRIQSRPF